MRRLALIMMVMLSASLCHGQANCFAHTSVQLGPPNVSAAMNDTGATMLIAFTTAYAGYISVKDVTGGPNTWYLVGNWGMGGTIGINVSVAINPVTNTAATFKVASGATLSDSTAQIWACNGVNTSDLFYQASGMLNGANGPASLGAAVGPTDTTITLRTYPSNAIKNGDYVHTQVGATQEYMLVTDATNQPASFVVQRGVLGTTGQSWVANQALFIGSGVGVQTCKPPAPVTPSAVGDLEFVAAGRAGTGSPTTGTTTATIDTTGFSTPLAIGGAATGTAGTVVLSWRVATDTSSFQPTLTMSASDQWQCVGLVIKGSTSPSSSEPTPLIHTVVGNGYQCNNPGASGSDCAAPAPGDGGPPAAATLNWPSEMLWYKHGVPPDKVMVFVDNQANLVRAVNFDTSPHTVANVVIQPNTIQTIAGTGNQAIGGADGGCTGNGGPALSATMLHPVSLAEDPTTGNLAVGDQQCATIDVIDTAGNFHWVAGGGSGGTTYPGCGNQSKHGNRVNVIATNALFKCPQGHDYDANGNLIIEDAYNYRIVFVNMQATTVNAYGISGIQAGYAVVIAGTGVEGCGAGYTPSAALSAKLAPLAISVDRPTGDVYVGSFDCPQVTKVTSSGQVVLLAGVDTSAGGGAPPPLGYSPDGTSATSAQFGYIFKVTKEADGLVHFTDTDNNLIRHIDVSGKVRTDVGNYARWGPKKGYMGGGWYGDNGSALRFELNYPIGYAYDSRFNLCVTSLMSNIIACQYGGAAPPAVVGGVFIAAATKWAGKAFIAGGGAAGTPQPIYGGPGTPGANSTITVSGSTVVLSTGDVLPQLQNTPETVGQSWTFALVNQAAYLILFGGSHTFKDANGFTFAFNQPIAVTVGGVPMYMYQSTNALNGSFTVKIAT